MDIKLEERGESYYQKLMEDVVAELDSRDLLKLEDGRKLMFVPDQAIPLTVVKSDGGYTYATSDKQKSETPARRTACNVCKRGGLIRHALGSYPIWGIGFALGTPFYHNHTNQPQP